jgi:hypothetical protein
METRKDPIIAAPPPDDDDFGSKRAKVAHMIDVSNLERDLAQKRRAAIAHSALEHD